MTDERLRASAVVLIATAAWLAWLSNPVLATLLPR
jgi:hypothetical protein